MMMRFTVKVVMNVFLTMMISVTQATIGLSFGSSSSGDVVCIESEKEALLSFKRDLVDPSNRLSSWDVSNEINCCKWAGVVCNNLTGHVQELHLANTLRYDFYVIDEYYHANTPKYYFCYDINDAGALRGKINTSLLSLKHLSYLDLSCNDFGGIQIPSFFGSLKSLTYLNLTRAGFNGIIPPQLGNLSSLRALVVHSDYDWKLYAENLHWLSSLSSLQHLDMSFVNLSQASDHLLQVINKLSSLSELLLSSCELSQFPNSVFHFNLTSLSILYLGDNHFDYTTSLSSWLFNLRSLVYLDLRSNIFDGPIPCGIKNLTALRQLDLSGNDFNSSAIPSCLYDLPKLEYLDLSFNNLEGGISSEIGNMTSIVGLDLSYNSLEGKLPTSLGNICNLKHIGLGGNKFGGNISDAFDSLSSGCLSSSLRSLDLSENSLSGHLTDQILEFRNLESLDVGHNNLSGPIPESVGKLSTLQQLSVELNQLNGSLPESLGGLSNLKGLDISSNLFEGVVTEAHFANLTNLKILSASGNSLSLNVSPDWIPPFHLYEIYLESWKLGPRFPTWLKTQPNVGIVDLSQTQIADTIPNWFWNFSSKIIYINVSHNHIFGTLPDILFSGRPHGDYLLIYLGSNMLNGQLPRISPLVMELDLSNNSFSGDISHFLCHQLSAPNSLRILHLGGNHLSGKFPDCWMHWPELQVINLYSNTLTGEIPDSLGSLQRLKSLHLRNNSLFGGIPPSLQNCSALIALDLGLNAFCGDIPQWMGIDLSYLRFLQLRSNKLNGRIPFELCHLSKLQILDLADNNLSGSIPKCFNNLKAMATKQESGEHLYYSAYHDGSLENAYVVTKGREMQYDTILTLQASLDLSANNLTGEIPSQLTSLIGLRALNLSANHLKGKLPDSIGNMVLLESLDLSRNQLSGVIAPGMSSLTFLCFLNLSYNNFSGKVPTSTQLQSLDASSFMGNKQLCGRPLPNVCDSDKSEPAPKNGGHKAEDGDEVGRWFRLGIGTGFAVGFFGIIAPLLFSTTWRHAYFEFLGYHWYKFLYKRNWH